MHNGTTLRIIITGAIAALAVTSPAAMAKTTTTSTSDVTVCNQATANNRSGEGYLDSRSFGDTGPAVKSQVNLKAHPGQGAGLVNAAAKSPALSQCIVPDIGGGSGGSTGWTPGDFMAT